MAGAAVRIYLPLAAVMPLPDLPPRGERSTRGTETILLVGGGGFSPGRVHRGQRGGCPRGARVSAEFQGLIDLLLTDAIRSGPSGPRLAETLVSLRPELAVLFMSGHNENTIVRQGGPRGRGVAYLQNPFKPGGVL